MYAPDYLVSHGGGLHEVQRKPVHFDQAVALLTVRHGRCCFLKYEQHMNLHHDVSTIMRLRSVAYLSPKDLHRVSTNYMYS